MKHVGFEILRLLLNRLLKRWYSILCVYILWKRISPTYCCTVITFNVFQEDLNLLHWTFVFQKDTVSKMLELQSDLLYVLEWSLCPRVAEQWPCRPGWCGSVSCGRSGGRWRTPPSPHHPGRDPGRGSCPPECLAPRPLARRPRNSTCQSGEGCR